MIKISIRMKFKNFYKKFTKEVYESSLNPRGIEAVEERIVSAWMIYQAIETNKKLIWATWSLAIATILLSGLTLYFSIV
ncbi:hypothetical protein CMI37_26605 [Candidatus Pacearchaeota archaeon]|nr:hypothetical protein [Candidatus Pacearchaeota archaeon]